MASMISKSMKTDDKKKKGGGQNKPNLKITTGSNQLTKDAHDTASVNTITMPENSPTKVFRKESGVKFLRVPLNQDVFDTQFESPRF